MQNSIYNYKVQKFMQRLFDQNFLLIIEVIKFNFEYKKSKVSFDFAMLCIFLQMFFNNF